MFEREIGTEYTVANWSLCAHCPSKVAAFSLTPSDDDASNDTKTATPPSLCNSNWFASAETTSESDHYDMVYRWSHNPLNLTSND